MSFEIVGNLHKVFDAEAKSERFQAREFVISTSGDYPQFIKFQLTQDRCDLINGYEEGKDIKVYFDLRGREWQGKFFTNLNAWKLEKVADAAEASAEPSAIPAAMGEPPEMGSFPKASDAVPSNTDLDDLPF